MVAVFWWSLTYDTKILTPCIYPHASNPDFFLCKILVFFFPGPQPGPILLLMIPYIFLSQAIFPWNLLTGKIFHSSCLSKPLSHAVNIHFGHAEPESTCQTEWSKFCFFFSLRLLIRDTLCSHRCKPRKGWCYSLDDFGVCITCSYSLLRLGSSDSYVPLSIWLIAVDIMT